MFIQVIEGTTRQPDALHERLRLWERELMAGAVGFVGSTAGCTSGGDCLLAATFVDADAARRSSDRPEQAAWWAGTAPLYEGEVHFHDSTDVQVMAHGDMSAAGFVQVMVGHVSDRARADAFTVEAEPMLAASRPDLLGSVIAYYDQDRFCELAYFTSEADARRAEMQEMPADVARTFADYQTLWRVDHYLDLTEPWMSMAPA